MRDSPLRSLSSARTPAHLRPDPQGGLAWITDHGDRVRGGGSHALGAPAPHSFYSVPFPPRVRQEAQVRSRQGSSTTTVSVGNAFGLGDSREITNHGICTRQRHCRTSFGCLVLATLRLRDAASRNPHRRPPNTVDRQPGIQNREGRGEAHVHVPQLRKRRDKCRSI